MSKMKLALVLMGLLVFISISLAASVQKSFTVVVDRSAPVVSCTGDTQLTNGGHGNSNDDRPNKDFHVEVQASKSTDVSAPIIAVGVSTDAVETELYVKGSEEIYQKEGYPYIPDPNYYSDDSFRSGSGHFDVSTDDDMNDENWNHRDNKKFDFGVYSSTQEGEVTVNCNAYDLLGQEGKNNYTAESTKITFCGEPVKEYTEEAYFCITNSGEIKYLGSRSGDVWSALYSNGYGTCDSGNQYNNQNCKNKCNSTLDDATTTEKISEFMNSEYVYFGKKITPKDYFDECVQYKGDEPEDQINATFKCSLSWVGPQINNGNCCVQYSNFTACTYVDPRFYIEFNNTFACSWMRISGCNKDGCMCLDHSSGNKINWGCFKEKPPWYIALGTLFVGGVAGEYLYVQGFVCDVNNYKGSDKCDLTDKEVKAIKNRNDRC